MNSNFENRSEMEGGKKIRREGRKEQRREVKDGRD